MASPCGGCPPCCKGCVFAEQGEALIPSVVVVPADDYGCVRGYGGVVADAAGRLGQVRAGLFHPVTPAGFAHLQSTNNPLAGYVG